jgi:hypothetical protein
VDQPKQVNTFFKSGQSRKQASTTRVLADRCLRAAWRTWAISSAWGGEPGGLKEWYPNRSFKVKDEEEKDDKKPQQESGKTGLVAPLE